MRGLPLAACLLALFVGGCAIVPKTHHRLEVVRHQYHEARGEETLARVAPREMEEAEAALRRAETAWHTRDDDAVVDHLAYLARQRLAIVRETARKAVAERDELAARLAHETLVSFAPQHSARTEGAARRNPMRWPASSFAPMR